MNYFNEEDERRFDFGLNKFFETQEDAIDFEITAFLHGKVKQNKLVTRIRVISKG